MVLSKFVYNNLILFVIAILILNGQLYFNCSSSNTTDNQTRASQPLGWSKDVRVSEKNNDYYCTSPHVAASDRYVHVLWDANLNSTESYKGLCYRRSTDGGNTWDDIVYLSDEYGCYSNDIAVSGPNVHTVFTSPVPNATGIVYRRSTDNGTTWEPFNVNLTDYGGTDFDIDTYNNNVHISFCYSDEREEKIWRIVYLRSTDNGDTWDKPLFIVQGKGITNYLRPRLEVCNRNIYIVYWGVNDTIELMQSQDNGGTWEHKTLHPGPNVGRPEIAGENNHIGVVWYNDSFQNHQLQFIKSDDYGKTWDEPKLINDQVEHLSVGPKTPSMIMINNTYHLAWEDLRDWRIEKEGVYPEIYYKKGLNAGNNWTNDLRLTKKEPKGPGSWDPSISVTGNNVYVCWEDEREDRSQIFFKRTIPDFIVDNLTVISSELLWANASINMTLSLKNMGFADGYFVNVTVMYLDNRIFNGQIERINLGEIENIFFTWKPIFSGSNTLKVIIDEEKNNQEWDEKNNEFIKTFTMIQENSAPIGKLKVDKDKAEVFENIKLDASDSYDPNGMIEAYYFDFGDGNNSGWINESEIIYNYSQAGIYKCSVEVRDNHGGINNEIVEQEIKIEWWPLPPVINNVTIDPSNPFCNENVIILVDAIDLNSDPLEYIYNPENGSIIDTGANVTWQAPEMPGEYKINVHVFDGTFNSSTWTMKISVRENQPPRIQNINYTSNEILPLESINITVNASDADGHSIQYDFISNGGTIIQNGSNATWEAPDEDGIYIITINISDAYGGYDQENIYIVVGEPKSEVLIKSFKATPDKLYKNEETEILVELEIEQKYIGLIDYVYLNLSDLSGNPKVLLVDTGLNGDNAVNDGIYSYKLSMKINNFTGEYRLWGTVRTTISGFEVNASLIINIAENPKSANESEMYLYLSSVIILIILFIIIVFTWSKFKRDKKKKRK